MTTSSDAPAQPQSSLPNTLTIARLVSAPVLAGLLLAAGQTMYTAGRDLTLVLLVLAFLVFLAAAITDWLDGAMARRLNAITPLGAALDHAADKALVTAALVALAATALPFDLVIAAAIIVTRDVAVAGLREGLSLSGRALPVSPLGKWKTAIEMIAIGAAIALQIAALTVPDAQRVIEPVNVLAFLTRASLWAAAALALWSGAEYAQAALKK
jgi:CDP-diacylglycerol--glycerol-3-phosphate 3-phosphatidyltransferase